MPVMVRISVGMSMVRILIKLKRPSNLFYIQHFCSRLGFYYLKQPKGELCFPFASQLWVLKLFPGTVPGTICDEFYDFP